METGESKAFSSPTSPSYFHRSSFFQQENAGSYLVLVVHGELSRGSLFDLHLNKIVALFSFQNKEEMKLRFQQEGLVGTFSKEEQWQDVQKYSVYPSGLLDEGKSSEIARMSFSVQDEKSIQTQELKALGLKLIFESTSKNGLALANLLQLSSLIHKEGHELFVFLSNNTVTLIAWKDAQLQFCTTNKMDSEADPAYFTASYLEGNSSQDLKIYLAGEPYFDKSIALLKRFYPNVLGMPTISNSFDAIDFPNIRPSQHFETIHLHLCAS